MTRTGRAYTPKKTKDAEAEIKTLASLLWKGPPLQGPLSVTVEFWMPIPTSLSKKKTLALIGTPHFKRPDVDNLTKLVLDALNEICWHDDAQISELRLLKAYATSPCVTVSIEPCTISSV